MPFGMINSIKGTGIQNSQGESPAFVWSHPATIPKGQEWSGNQRTTAWPRLDRIQKEIEEYETQLMQATYPCIQQRLDEIALRPHPFSTPDYIDLTIATEKKPNFAFLNWILLPKIWKRISDFDILKFLWGGWVKCDPMTSITCRLWDICATK